MRLTDKERQDMIQFFDQLENQLEADGHEDMASEAAYWLDRFVSAAQDKGKGNTGN